MSANDWYGMYTDVSERCVCLSSGGKEMVEYRNTFAGRYIVYSRYVPHQHHFLQTYR